MVQSSHAFLIISSVPIIFRPNDPRLFLQFFGKRNISGSYYSRFFNQFLEEYCTNMKTRCLHACTYFQQARCPEVHSNKDYKFCRYKCEGTKTLAHLLAVCTHTPTHTYTSRYKHNCLSRLVRVFCNVFFSCFEIEWKTRSALPCNDQLRSHKHNPGK